jgi:hypothetical protein
MPDLINRTSHEQHIAYGLAAELTRQRNDLATYGVEKLPERPAIEWERDKEELAALLLLLLRDPWFTAHHGLAGSIGLATLPDRLEARYQAWGNEYAKTTAGQIVDNTRDMAMKAAKASQAASGGGTAVMTRPSLLPDVANTTRIVRGAISMTTDAASAGEYAVAAEFERQEAARAERAGAGSIYGRPAARKLVPYWVTERDGRVCPICAPLDGKPESAWVKKFPNGPKAHVACRCYLDWRVE